MDTYSRIQSYLGLYSHSPWGFSPLQRPKGPNLRPSGQGWSTHLATSTSSSPDVESADNKLKKLVGEAYLEDGLYFLNSKLLRGPAHANKASLQSDPGVSHLYKPKNVLPEDNLSLRAHSGCRLARPPAFSGPAHHRNDCSGIDSVLRDDSTIGHTTLGPCLNDQGKTSRTAAPMKHYALRRNHPRPQKERFCPKLDQSSPKGLLWRKEP